MMSAAKIIASSTKMLMVDLSRILSQTGPNFSTMAVKVGNVLVAATDNKMKRLKLNN
jgi:hypothetical protein